MGRRFSRVKQGAYYNTALGNYIEYLNTAATRPRQIGTRDPMDFKSVYVRPFGTNLGGTTELVEGRAQDTHITKLQPLINTASTKCKVYIASGLESNTVVSLNGFKPARVIWQNATSRDTTVKVSQITGLQYLGYNNVGRYSCPFGRDAETDNIFSSFGSLKVLLKSQAGAINRVSLTEENITYEA